MFRHRIRRQGICSTSQRPQSSDNEVSLTVYEQTCPVWPCRDRTPARGEGWKQVGFSSTGASTATPPVQSLFTLARSPAAAFRRSRRRVDAVFLCRQVLQHGVRRRRQIDDNSLKAVAFAIYHPLPRYTICVAPHIWYLGSRSELLLEFCILPSTRSRLSQDSLNL